MAKTSKYGIRSVLDFCIDVYKEKIDGKGEDSYFYSVSDEKAVFGVFDGCGGSGARRYEKLQGRTGAYMASRVISGAVKDWFDSSAFFDNDMPNIAALTEKMREYLEICKHEGDTASAIKGRLARSFPTTAAAIALSARSGQLNATCFWAGDSRCYMLDETGLMQLTEDDIRGLDAMENLTSDGGLTNVISADSRIKLHTKTLPITRPCILFSATDGCFGYLSTPMEFEYLLLDMLINSASISEFENGLKEFLRNVAGDDLCLCGCAIGYGTLEKLQNSLKPRRAYLLSEYINGIEETTQEEKLLLWHKYAPDYSRYLDIPRSSLVPDEKPPENIPVEKDSVPAGLSMSEGHTNNDKKTSGGFKRPTDLG